MFRRFGLLPFASSRPRARNSRRWLALARVLALVMLFLLPMQVRAGAEDPHPHALLHLILDARDGVIDHHADDGHAGASVLHEPAVDVPEFGDSHGAAASWALLAALVLVFLVPLAGCHRVWPMTARWTGRLPALDPPPPRIDRA